MSIGSKDRWKKRRLGRRPRHGLSRPCTIETVTGMRKTIAIAILFLGFGAALAEFNGVLKSSDREEVKQRVLREKLDITTRADEAYQKLDEQARDKIRGQYYAEAKALYARVVDTFGLEPYVGRATGEIAVLEDHPNRLPWRDVRPPALVDSLAPFEGRLAELFCPEATHLELTRNRSTGVGIQGD